MDEEKEPVRLRAACDRCHSQKLRCPKVADAEQCDRCRKARRPCVFSPFRQKKTDDHNSDSERASMNAQLCLLEQQISIIKEKNRSARAGVKRKSDHQLLKQDTSSTPQALNSDTPSVEAEGCLSLPDPSDFDWTSSTFPFLNDFDVNPAFDDTDFGAGITLPQITYTSLSTDRELHGQKSQDYFRLPSPPIRLYDLGAPSIQPSQASILPRIPPKTTNLFFEWGNNINTEHPRSEKHLIRQLADLSMGLYDHFTTIPPLSIHDRLPDGSEARPLPHWEYSADDTFKLTQDLIDIYPAFLDTFVRGTSAISQDRNGEPSLTESNPGCTISADALCSDSQRLGPLAHDLVSYDHSSILLLLSCHVRIIDIYDSLFVHMRICMDGNASCASENSQRMYGAPPVKIGNFTPPPSSAVPMQMMLLIQFASQLLDNSTDLAAHLQIPPSHTPLSDTGTDAAALLSWNTAEKVKCRANDMLQELSAVRTEILGKGFLA